MIFSLCSKYKFLVSPAFLSKAITDAPNPSVFKYSRYSILVRFFASTPITGRD
nr:MAG TPA: hypothetical protein [Caudoviricetes sp.]